MDEHEKQDIGDGSDDYMGGAQKAADAAKQFDQSGDETGGGSNSEEPPSKDGDNNNSEPSDSKNADSGTDNTNSKNPDNNPASPEANADNPAVNANNSAANTQSPQNAGNQINAATPKGAESGANQAQQAAQTGTEAGANIAQKGAEVAAKGVEAGANAAAAAVQAGMEGGKAVAEIAAGTAAGGPWGAVISAAWAMRHTIFKVIICICLILTFLIVMVVSLPSIIFNYVFRTDPASAGVPAAHDIHVLFEEMSVAVADCVTAGYDYAFAKVEKIIADGGYDYEYSMQALINHGATSAEYDICYVLAAYSVAMEQRGTTKEDMVNKLMAVKDQMFLVTYAVKETTITVPAETEDGEDTVIEVKYIEATIHPFDQSVILTAFGIDPSAQYSQFNITNGVAITNMANALRLTMFGSLIHGAVPLITDAELAEFIANLNTTQQRKELVTAALSLVGRVPYFWGGKSAAGWNNDWNTPRVVTSVGSSSTGTLRPFGLDCSGFTDWVYKTALGVSIGAGSWNQWDNSTSITQSQLLPGDLGYMAIPGTVPTNHVLIYAGKDSSGNLLWVHCEWGTGVHINSPDYIKYFRRPNIDWED